MEARNRRIPGRGVPEMMDDFFRFVFETSILHWLNDTVVEPRANCICNRPNDRFRPVFAKIR